MKRALCLLVLAGCIDEIDARWQLDHDHVIAARATPPRIRDGETTSLDALVAHEGRSVSVEIPSSVEIGAQTPVSVDLLLTFPHARVMKTVWIGEPAQNPVVPPVTIDGIQASDKIVVPIGRDVYLSVDAPNFRVNWLTSVGTLFQDDVSTAFVRVTPDDRREGELVVVVRDSEGGVAWQVWSMRAE